MCYNKDISIYTYILGLISSYLLIINDKPTLKILGVFFIVSIHMQLIEFYLWTNNTCNNKNIQISIIGAIVNFIQPIILYLSILYFNKTIEKNNKTKLHIIILVYIIILIIYIMRILPIGCSTMNEYSKPYLEWSWMYEKHTSYIGMYFPIAIMLLLYIGLDKPYNIYLSLLCIISFILSYIIYRKQRAFGNIWCWFTVFIPICILLYDKFIMLQ